MTYKQAKVRLEKCRDEIKKLGRKIEAQEIELEGLVKLCELLKKYEQADVPKEVMNEYNGLEAARTDSTPIVTATVETTTT